jgi:formylglycine-generating enzyme required for sulfatase activity
MGNVEEWTRDRWRDPATGEIDLTDAWRATRGLPLRQVTSHSGDVYIGAANRARLCIGTEADGCPPPRDRNRTIGFRCVRPQRDAR